MRKRTWFQTMTLIILTMSMVIGQSSIILADEGAPQLVLSGKTVIDVNADTINNYKMQLKNKGGSTAENVYVKAKTVGTDPFEVSLRSGSDLGNIGTNGYQNISFDVEVTDEVKEAQYSFILEYSYTNGSGTAFTGTDTIHLKMNGFDEEPSFKLDGMEMTPSTLNPGTSGELKGEIVNNGEQTMTEVDISISNLTTEGISLSGGFNNKFYDSVDSGSSVNFSFPLVASADMAAGNYPVTLKIVFKDEFGKVTEREQQYYINVGGIAGQKAMLEIHNMVEPSGIYGVNENFTITFDLYNNGLVAAKDIVISAKGLDDSAVVPKSANMQTIQNLEPGETAAMTFTFASTAASKTQNYAIEFSAEYTSGGTAVSALKQFAGVNVTNPDNDKEEEDEDEQISTPKIIISKYMSDPVIVMAGEEFDLNLTLLNTHREKGVENIKMFLTLAEETSSDSEKSGNIFTPVESSNTFYFDSIPAKGTVDKNLRLYVVPEAQPKTYTLTVNFEYEDSEGKEYKATELLGINVKQVTQLQVDEFSVPEMVQMHEPINVSFSYYNTGKVTLNNVMIKIEGEVDTPVRNTYIGNMESGDSNYFEASFIPTTSGEIPVSVVVSYEDAAGEPLEERKDLVLNVMEPMMPDDLGGLEPEEPPMDMKKMSIALAILAVGAMALFVFIKKQKDDVHSGMAESIDADDDEDDEEGMNI